MTRPLTPEDKPLIESWIAREPEHQNNTFEWYRSGKSVMYADSEGPVFVARFTPVIRIDVDFNPDASKDRIRTMLKSEFPNVCKQVKEQGFGEVVFSSASKTLIAFFRMFGVTAIPDYRKCL